MTENRFYCIDEDEYNSYWIADTSKVDKNKEDFYDEKEELYQIYEFEEYLEDNNAVLKGEEVVDLLNETIEENQKLKQKNEQLNKNINSTIQYIDEIIRANEYEIHWATDNNVDCSFAKYVNEEIEKIKRKLKQ